MPSFANGAIAPTISLTHISKTPRAIAGTCSNFEVSIPNCATLLKTSLIMDPFLIILAVILFIELAKANDIEVNSPLKCSPELLGHQSFFLYSLKGISIQYSISGTL